MRKFRAVFSEWRELDPSSGKPKEKERSDVKSGQKVVLNSSVLIEASSHPL